MPAPGSTGVLDLGYTGAAPPYPYSRDCWWWCDIVAGAVRLCALHKSSGFQSRAALFSRNQNTQQRASQEPTRQSWMIKKSYCSWTSSVYCLVATCSDLKIRALLDSQNCSISFCFFLHPNSVDLMRRVVNPVPLRSASPRIEITSWRCNARCRWHWKHNSWSRVQIKKHLRFIILIGGSWEGQLRQSVGGGCGSESAVNCGSEQLSEGGTKGRVAIRLCFTPSWAYRTSHQHWPLNNSPEGKWK
jgi:hypothetical protein